MSTQEFAPPPLLDSAALSRVSLDEATRVTYRLEQTFRYDYDEPVRDVRQRLVVVPPAQHGDVHLRRHSIEVSGSPARKTVRRRDGNTHVHVRADRVEGHIEFRLAADLERVATGGTHALAPGLLADPRWLAPTRLTRPDEHLLDWAASLRGAGDDLETAEAVCTAVHDRMTYEFGPTSTRTTAAQALAGGRGVCQDYAHIMLALCHELGIRARYVSGHLIGQGGTHAWVEVGTERDGAAVAVAFDPCNRRRAGNGYITVATGRDYTDVAPTSGTYDGPPTGRLSSTRRLGVVTLAA